MKVYFHKNEIEHQLGVKELPGLSVIKQDPKVRWLDIPEYLHAEFNPKDLLEDLILEMQAWMEVHMEKDREFTTDGFIKHMRKTFIK